MKGVQSGDWGFRGGVGDTVPADLQGKDFSDELEEERREEESGQATEQDGEAPSCGQALVSVEAAYRCVQLPLTDKPMN